MIVVEGLRKSFNGTEVLHGIDLEVARGETVCLIGPSGSGKSTVLRCLNHLETPDDGTVTIGGDLIGYRRDGDVLVELPPRTLARQRERVGMVFQQFNLFPHLTARQNITEAPRRTKRLTAAEADTRAAELMERVGLGNRLDAYPEELSGGQQQRVAIARALAMSPDVLLFDEPTSALDPEMVDEVLAVIRELAGSGITLVVVTHEMRFAADAADRVVVMESGRIVEQGPARQLLNSPAHDRTRSFLSKVVP